MFDVPLTTFDETARSIGVTEDRLREIVGNLVGDAWPWKLEDELRAIRAELEGLLAGDDDDQAAIAVAGRREQVLTLAVQESLVAWGLRDEGSHR